MLHEPAPASPDKDYACDRKARLGLKLFWIYCIIYAGFVALNTMAPKVMEARVLFGMNLAAVYGFGLILLAIGLGLAYNALCTAFEDRVNNGQTGKEG
ncbi:MAG: DUF485 domain-containing protein [Candidatus Pacebacteria bacterium]|nr:DUF485 domain-containing protein [Candidatus Paceibacterota bacterium]